MVLSSPPFVQIYTQPEIGESWLSRWQGKRPLFALVLGFTDTGLIPNISAAGATPASRRLTALADAEFLVNGPVKSPQFPLPPLQAGASPALISRAILAEQGIPLQIFDAGLPQPPSIPTIALGGSAANCLSTAQALPLSTVQHLFQAGLQWGQALATLTPDSYIIVGECVVGGTTTAQAVLCGLGIAAEGQVNSSHPTCNHHQKQQVVRAGLSQWQAQRRSDAGFKPLALVAAIGDPMQPFTAGLALASSRSIGVMLAGGTQMLAVLALMRSLATTQALFWRPENVVVGTTRWVAEDPTGNTIELAGQVQSCLIATQLSFTASKYAALRAYEQGFVKEGVGAGGCSIAAHLYQGWGQDQTLQAIEHLIARQTPSLVQEHENLQTF